MTFTVRITSSAFDDMGMICQWLVGQGASVAAERWIADTMESIQSLDSFPERCPLALEASASKGPVVRQLLVGQYRILFVVEGQEVLVILVRHGKRNAIPVGELLAAWNRRTRLKE